jgi:hypothetical protein
MFRKLILGSVTSLALVSPLALPTNAQASGHGRYHHRHAFTVYYRDPCRPVWTCGGTYRYHRAAERVAQGYRLRGLVVEIR